MATRIHAKQVKNLSQTELRQCYGLNLGSSGDMRYMLKDCRVSKDKKTHTFLLKEDGKKILAWAIVFDLEIEPSVYFYTRKGYRNQGLASRLMKRVLREYPGVCVYPHDPPSRAFFNKYDKHVTFS